MGVAESNCNSIRCNDIINDTTSMRSWSRYQNDEAIIRIMMPVYYIKDTLTLDEILMAKSSWENILNGVSKDFYNYKAKCRFEDFSYISPLEWFQDLFYKRLFDVHPVSFYHFTKFNFFVIIIIIFLNIFLMIDFKVSSCSS